MCIHTFTYTLVNRQLEKISGNNVEIIREMFSALLFQYFNNAYTHACILACIHVCIQIQKRYIHGRLVCRQLNEENKCVHESITTGSESQGQKQSSFCVGRSPNRSPM